MRIIDVEHNQSALEDGEAGRVCERTLGGPLIEGEGTPTPMFAWDVAIFLCSNREKTLYGLEVVDFGNTTEKDDDEKWEPVRTYVSVASGDVRELSEEEIAKALFEYHQAHSERYVEGISRMGPYDLWDALEAGLRKR